MYSTVQSVVFSLHPPPFLKSEHWSQQNTGFFLPPCWSCQTFHVPNPVCVAQHPLELVEGISAHSHRAHSAASSLWDQETKVKTQGRESIGFILVSWCWYGCQCFLEYVHVTRSVLYEFLLILPRWLWLIVFSSKNVSSANKSDFFSLSMLLFLQSLERINMRGSWGWGGMFSRTTPSPYVTPLTQSNSLIITSYCGGILHLLSWGICVRSVCGWQERVPYFREFSA